MSVHSSIQWSTWSATPAGQVVLSWEQAQLDILVSNLFGYHAVQLGLPQLPTLRENRIPCRTLVLDTTLDGGGNTSSGLPFNSVMHCTFPELPFATQSIDLLVLPHTLELTRVPHQLLREAVRTLLPEGQIVMTGFNSFSLWGLRHMFRHITGSPFMPALHPLINFARLKDWLKLLGLELHQGHFGVYRPPCGTERWLNRYHFLEAAGNRWWPIFGAVYLITAIKRTPGIRLIGPAPLDKSSLLPAPAPVSSTSHTFSE